VSEKIDFEKELEEIIPYTEFLACNVQLVAWARSIAARVEESTIQRCGKYLEENSMFKEYIPRLYSPKPDGEIKP